MNTGEAVLGETLVEASAIRSRIAELGRAIDAAYSSIDRPVVLLCVLKGALLFTADLARALTVPVEIDCITVRSYGTGTESTGTVELVKGTTTRLRDRDVLIVEDIVDTGHTAAFLRRHLADEGARSVRMVTLLDKVSRRERAVVVDWRGFEVPDRFVVGYGLDHGERFRNLAEVRALDLA